MSTDEAARRLTEVIRHKHLALATERSYCAWLRRYCDCLKVLSSHLSSEQKLEHFLTQLAKKDVAASAQNQASHAIIFFYEEALGAELKNVQALQARRPAPIRRAPAVAETPELIKMIQGDADFATSLAVGLLQGCGLRERAPQPPNQGREPGNCVIDHPRRQRRQGPCCARSLIRAGGLTPANRISAGGVALPHHWEAVWICAAGRRCATTAG